MTYITATDVRVLTNLSVSDIDDTALGKIINYAVYQLNHDITAEVIREKIEYIDGYRENDIDGSNTTFFVKNWEGKYIADRDNDGDVDISDIEVFEVDESADTETSMTVSSITHNKGKFVLSTAPVTGKYYYITYKWSYVDTSTPSPLVKMACVLLSAAWAHAKINWGTAPSVSFGNTRILRHMESFDKFYRQYQRIVNQINNKAIEMREAKNLI